MAWLFLFLAGLFEIVWAVSSKYSNGFTRFWPSVLTLSSMVVSVVLLTLAIRTLPLGTAYSIWVGLGAIGTVVAGILMFDESASPARLACVGLIVAGVAGLKLVK